MTGRVVSIMARAAIALTVTWAGAGCDDGDGSGDEDTSVDTVEDTAVDSSVDSTDDTGGDVPTDESVDEPADTDPDCEPPAVASGSEGHAPGTNCMSCHGSMSGSLRFTVAGTLYTSATGSTPLGGATVVITDASASESSLITHPNGNFYSSQPVTFPIGAKASKCPDSAQMSALRDTGACNSCHNSSQRIHLP